MNLGSQLPDTLLLIAQALDSDRDLNALCQTNRHIHAVVGRYLYQHNVRCSNGSALLWAALQGREHTAELSLEAGANIDMANSYGYTPLHQAVRSGQLELTNLLLERGCHTSMADLSGQTPLHMAAVEGDVEILKALLRYGADPTCADGIGWTPLAVASHVGYVDVVEMLLRSGADPASADSQGRTPLHHAAARGRVAAAKLLIQYGADVAATADNGSTPLGIATRLRFSDTVQVLTAACRPSTDTHDAGRQEITDTMPAIKFSACFCCGYLTREYGALPGTYWICNVCGWEDDDTSVRDPLYAGGANGPSLWEAQQQFQKLISASLVDREPRDSTWRQIDLAFDEFNEASTKSPEAKLEPFCWWLPDFQGFENLRD
ncbi:hypothetical protein NQ176_g1030 [Zarea fungicola]|uniref:Uncharacterized protein n=1 Tax=Zarea fungicola TaxID=93591 RepID=A0ACC1NVZ9_9HYPO|nr:hypothetical protein NQ176_g1030 [Lecanicillium fungicola]